MKFFSKLKDKIAGVTFADKAVFNIARKMKSPRVVQFSFQAAGQKAREVGLFAPDMSVNDSMAADDRMLLNQSEHLFKNNIWAKRAAVLFSLNLNRTKTLPTLRPLDRSDKRAVRGLEKLKEWLDDAEYFDFKGKENFDSGITLLGKELQRAGGFLIRKRTDPSDKRFPLRIEFISVRAIDHTKNQSERSGNKGNVFANRIVNGIESDNQGRVVAYWLTKDQDHIYKGSFRVSVKECKYLSIYDFICQDKGIPQLTQAFIRLNNLDEWQHNLLTKNRKQAAETHIIEQPFDDDNGDNEGHNRKRKSGMTQEEVEKKYQETIDRARGLPTDKAAYILYNGGVAAGFQDAESQAHEYVQPGDTIRGNNTVWLTPGWTYKQSSIQSVDNSDYVNTEMLGISSCSGHAHASMTGDSKQANFSSLKHSKNDADALIKQVQVQFLYPKVCDQIVKWYREYDEMRNGYTDLPRKIVWVSCPSEALHQLEKVKAVTEEVRAGFRTWEDGCREFGSDPQKILESARHRQTELDGLKFTSDPNALDNTGKPIITGVPA
jgi:capsid protein